MNVELLDTVPLVLTVTVADPCVAMRAALTAPLNWEAFPKVVGRGDPFHKMVELAANPEPFTVRVNAAPLACTIDGLRLLITGFTVAGVIVKVELLDTVPFVLTATVAVPCAAMRLAPTAPVNWLALPNAVGRADPFHKIVELALNPEPVTVRVNAIPPACADDGLRPLMVTFAVAGVMVNVALLETTPLLLTVTATVPCVVMRLAPTAPVN